ncbi:CpsB/CapC family capsule biosynthesis tyrosine phosphatase [Serpentinicella sp. ANB-PHB4]|uniref:tyrosine-protein phosphatase n=1 Tax=Serpentinicella sp. ANB-PHB4 TaxID=3074076 RepID=UPI00285C0332|nr:CpsB/CapC family capsule biosynthesis tyrosine phosphatase [Serpentinicella sp. ANB-PHB4]MDR5659934.1 CpsB/CapC family capsule biosynthesis tyrosine phosphatase [Serpentinicella sp. ANB-PHB4]
MVDLHSHILPCIDDGARSEEETISMGRIAMEEGITHIMATPHYFGEGRDKEKAIILEKVELVNKLFQQEGINVEVLPGNEAYLSLELPDKLKNGDVLTLNNGPYILVEFPMNNTSLYIDEILYEIRLQGYYPIIAHPERYRQVVEDPNIVCKWIEQGNYIQVNAMSILGKHGEVVQDTAEILMTHNMVHFIGTDAHSPRSRAPRINRAFEMVNQWVGPELVAKLQANNLAVLKGHEVQLGEAIEYEEQISFLKSFSIKNLFKLGS